MKLKAQLLALLQLVVVIAISKTSFASFVIRPPHPVILIHGLGGTPQTWNMLLTKATGRHYRWEFGGQLTVINNTVRNVIDSQSFSLNAPRNGDVYTIRIPNSHWRNFFDQSEDLAKVVDFVLQITNKQKVVLLGHSMGGLTARAFISSRENARKVSQLITSGTPHLGSPYATLDPGLWLACVYCANNEFYTPAIRSLLPGSSELRLLNNTDYSDKVIAFTSIIISNDDVVSSESQNLQNTGIRILSHKTILLENNRRCLVVHLCETSNESIVGAMAQEALRYSAWYLNLESIDSIAITLRSERQLNSSFEVKLETNLNLRVTGDFYMGFVKPNGEIAFLQSLTRLVFGPEPRALLREIEAYETTLFTLNESDEILMNGLELYAIFIHPNYSVFSGYYLSNLAGPLRLEAGR